MNRKNISRQRIRRLRNQGFTIQGIAVECCISVADVLEALRMTPGEKSPPRDRTEEKQRAERIRAVEWARRQGFDEAVIQANFEEAR